MASGSEDLPRRCANCGCCPTCGKPNNWPYLGIPYIQYPYIPIPAATPIWVYTPLPTGFINVGSTGQITYGGLQYITNEQGELCSQ